jgi:hypothetical protein
MASMNEIIQKLTDSLRKAATRKNGNRTDQALMQAAANMIQILNTKTK